MFILSIMLLSACSVSLSEKEQRRFFRKPSLSKQALSHQSKAMKDIAESGWPTDRWWHDYHSKELSQLIEQGLNHNPNIQVFKANINAYKANTVIKRSLRAPYTWFHTKTKEQQRSHNGLYRALNPHIPLTGHEVDFGFNFRYEFDFWGKNTNIMCAAIGEEKVAEAELASVQLMTTTSIATSYFIYSSLGMTRSLLKQLKVVEQKILQLQNKLLQKGLISKLPVLETKKNIQTINMQIAENERQTQSAKHLTNILSGRNPDNYIRGKKLRTKLPLKLNVPKSLNWDFIARRPELMAQIWMTKSLAYKTGAAIADFYPNIDLVGFAGLETVTWDKLLQIASGTALLRPALHLPLFTAGAIQANVDKNKADYQSAVFAYNEQLLKASQEVLDNLAAMVETYHSLLFQNQAVNAVRERYQLSKLRNQKGLDSALSKYQYQQEYLLAQLKQIETIKAQYVASVHLIKSLGGGYYQSTSPLVRSK